MSACIVMVRFVVETGRREDFLPLVETNARRSLADEPGCRRFDVVVVEAEPDVVLLYEIYDDPAAFDAHRNMPHFHRFEADSAHLVSDKTISVGQLSAGSPAPKPG